LVAYDKVKTWYYLFLILQSFALFVYIVRFVRDREAIKFAIVMLLRGMLIESVLMIALRIHNQSFDVPFVQFRIDTDDASRVAGTVRSPVTASCYLSLLLASSLALTLTPVSRRIKQLSFAAFCLG